MPFDGTLFLSTTPRAKFRLPRIRASTVGLVLGCGMVFSFGLEKLYPDRGPISLLVDGPSVVHQNIIAYDILENGKRLQFNIGNISYTVVSPNHMLAADEQTAWMGFAKRKSLPLYSVDGPMAIDP